MRPRSRAHLLSIWHPVDPQRRALIERSLAAGDALSAAELARATPRQRAYLSRLLAGYAQDAEALAAAAEAAGARNSGRAAMAGALAAPLGAR